MSTSLLNLSNQVIRSCPVCGRPLHIGVHLNGKKVTCGHCRGRFTASDSDDLSGGLAARVDRLLRGCTPPTGSAGRTASSCEPDALSRKRTAGNGRGLTYVTMVRPRQRSGTETARAEACSFPGKFQKALLVEHRDEVFVRLAADLESIQLRIARALNAREASRQFAVAPFDLMIANVDLIDESGWLLACKIRLLFPAARIWLYTAHPSPRDMTRARYLGVARLIHYGGDPLRLGGELLHRLT